MAIADDLDQMMAAQKADQAQRADPVPPVQVPMAAAPADAPAPAEVTATPPPTQSSVGADLDSMMKEAKLREQAGVQTLFTVSKDQDPERAGQVYNLAQKLRTDPSFVDRNYDTLKTDVAVNQIDYAKLSRLHPSIVKLANDPVKAAAMRDQLTNLSGFDNAVKDHSLFEDAINTVGYGTAKLLADASKIPAAMYDTLALKENAKRWMRGDPTRVTSDDTPFGRNNLVTMTLEEMAKSFKDQLPILNEDVHGAFLKTVHSAADAPLPERMFDAITQGDYVRGGQVLFAHTAAFAPSLLAMIGLSMVNPAAGPAMFGGTTLGERNAENLAEGMDPVVGTPNAIAHGAIAGYFSQFGINSYFSTLTGRLAAKYGPEVTGQVMKSFGASLLKATGAEAGTMAGMSLADDFADYTMRTNPEALQGSIGRAFDAGLMGAVMGAGTHVTGESLVRANEARRVEATRDFIENLATMSKESKLRERSPEIHSEFVKESLDGSGAENVQIAPQAIETYFQAKGVNPVKAMQDLGFLQQFGHAKETGTNLTIPTEKFIDSVVKNGHDDLVNDIKLHEEDLSVNELRQKNEAAEKAAEAQAQALDEAESQALSARGLTLEQQRAESAAKVREHIEAQLEAAGRDKTEAQVVSKSVETLAQRANVDPLELFNRINLSISGPDSKLEVPSNARQLEQSAKDTEAIARAKEVLNRVDTVEKATSLRGDERQEYLDALDTMYGDRATRAKQMGFDDQPVFHGSKSTEPIDAFSNAYSGTGVDAGNLGAGTYITPKEWIADAYRGRGGETYALRERDTNPLVLPEPQDAEHLRASIERAAKDLGVEAAAEWNENGNGNVSKAFADEFAQKASDAGYTSIRQGAEANVLEPQNLRSVTAAFDPRFRDSAKILAQGGDETPRGVISIAPDRINIQLLEKANPSTFQHEVGHFIVEMMKRLSPESEQIKADFETLMRHVGNDGGEITVDQHEEIARSFEAYLMEGKSPSLDLRKAFERIKTWMVDVYKHLSALNVNLTDDVRQVFDRVIATDDEIERAQAAQDVTPLFTEGSMPKDQFERYKRAFEESKAAAQDELRAKVMEDIRKEKTELYKRELEETEARVTEQAKQMPVYQALSILQKGERIDGTALPEHLRDLKIDRQMLVDEYGKDIIQKLPKPVIYGKDGLHPDMIADLLGYDTGEQMIEEFTRTPRLQDYIEQTAKADMEAKDPKLFGSTYTPELAMQAIHNDQRDQVLRMELDHLRELAPGVDRDIQKRLMKRPAPSREMREQMEAVVGKQNVADLAPNKYRVAERQAAAAAGEAYAKGDIQGAFDAKTRELMNYHLFKAAQEAKTQIEQDLKFFRKLGASDEKLAKSRDMNLVNTARAVLASFGIGRTDAAPITYLEKMQAYDPDGFSAATYHVHAATDGGTAENYKQISFGRFATMSESVKALYQLARDSKEVEIGGKKLQKDAVVSDLVAQLTNHGDINAPRPGTTKAITWRESTNMTVMGIKASLRRVEHWAHAIDGEDYGGVTVKNLVLPIKEAETTLHLKKTEMMKHYLEQVVQPSKDVFDAKPIEAPEIGYTFENKSELLGALMHTGNESNLSKLLRGRGWGSVMEDGTLDRSRWDQVVDRLQKDGTLTKADYDYVQGVWDMYEKMKPDVQKAHYKLLGYHFNEVTAEAFDTPFGQYKGGYAPAIADPNISEDAALRREKESFNNKQDMMMMPTTGRGFTKSRIEAYAAPLALDLRYIPMQIDKMLRFTYMEPAVRDASKLVLDRTYANALGAIDSQARSEMLIPWLQRAASQATTTPSGTGRGYKAMDNFFRALRSRTGLNAMVGNVINAFHQTTGFSVAAALVEPKYIRDATIRYTRQAADVTAAMHEKSAYMRAKEGQIGELQDELEKIMEGPSRVEETVNWIKKNGYFLQRFTAGMTEAVAWTSGYDKAIAEGKTEQEAVAFGDSVVRRTQHSASPTDVARFGTGNPMQRLFTMYFDYFNNKANLNLTQAGNIGREFGLKKGLAYMAPLYAATMMVPALMTKSAYKVAQAKLDENDDGSYMDDVLKLFFHSQVDEALTTVPFGTAVVGTLQQTFDDNTNNDRLTFSPAFEQMVRAVQTPRHISDAIGGRGRPSKAIKDVFSLLGLMSGLPVQPLSRPIGYAADVASGKARSDGPLDYARGLVTGYGPKR